MKNLLLTILITVISINVFSQSPDGYEMVLVTGGTFTVGKNEQERVKPKVQVTLPDFFIGKYEVTQEFWESVMGKNPSKFTGEKNLPVEKITWYDAVEFCNRLSEKYNLEKAYSIKEGIVSFNPAANGYRLPREAEWEFAATGGTQRKNYLFPGSNKVGEVAWYKENSGDKTHPVGLKLPNELGLYDMAGNVREWCWDFYSENATEADILTEAPFVLSERVTRGGNWMSSQAILNGRDRSYDNPTIGAWNLGLRLARNSK